MGFGGRAYLPVTACDGRGSKGHGAYDVVPAEIDSAEGVVPAGQMRDKGRRTSKGGRKSVSLTREQCAIAARPLIQVGVAVSPLRRWTNWTSKRREDPASGAVSTAGLWMCTCN